MNRCSTGNLPVMKPRPGRSCQDGRRHLVETSVLSSDICNSDISRYETTSSDKSAYFSSVASKSQRLDATSENTTRPGSATRSATCGATHDVGRTVAAIEASNLPNDIKARLVAMVRESMP
jgi:hypothetical protein